MLSRPESDPVPALAGDAADRPAAGTGGAGFRDIVALAAEICGASTAVLLTREEDGLRVAFELGLGLGTLGRLTGPAGAALLARAGLTVVPDLAADPELAAEPLLAPLGRRGFVAAVRIDMASGVPVGLLVVADPAPRPEGLGAGPARMLRGLGRQIAAELELARLAADRAGEIARLRAVESDLRASEGRYRALFEQAAVGVAHSDLQGRLVLANRTLAEILGYEEAAELLGRDTLEMTHPDDRTHEAGLVGDLLVGLVPWIRRDKRLRRKDGSYAWVGVTTSLVADAAGGPVHRVAVIEDAGPRRRAAERERRVREELEARADELAALFAAAPVGLTVLDRDLRFVRINERMAEINGVPAADHIGRTVQEVVPDLAEAAVAQLRRVLSGERLIGIEISGMTPARPGVLRTWRESWLPLRGQGGEVAGVLISAEEITEEKAEERRQAYRLALTERLRDLSEPQALMDAASELLGRHMGARLVGLAEAEPSGRMLRHRCWVEGAAEPATGATPLSALGDGVVEALRGGATVAVSDVRADPRTSSPGIAGGHESAGTRSFVAVPVVREQRLAAVLLVTQAQPRDWPAAEVGLIEETLERLSAAIDRGRAEARLRASEARFRALFEQMPLLAHVFDPEGRTIMVNPALERTYGLTAEQIVSYNMLTDPQVDRSGLRALLEAVFLRGETVRLPPVRHESPLAGGARRAPWIESLGFPIKDETGAIREVVFLSQDVTERMEAGERERLLAREVDHRAKNMLAVVQSVVQLTRAGTIEEFKAAVGGRVQSLARAHSLLAASRWEGIDLGELVREELEPFARAGSGRVRSEGPPLRLAPAGAQALALVLHELTTNAAKYGSLSADDGRVEVGWSLSERRLALVWRESGGPAVQPPDRKGFGSTLIRASVERQLGGELAMDWRPEGLEVRVALPEEQVVGTALGPVAPPRAAVLPGPGPGTTLLGARVLVVEDEALIALQIGEAVEALGGEVLGPAATVEEALRLLAVTRPEVAVLDLNLSGQRSEPVAEALVRMGVPFLFCTGYGEDAELPPALGAVQRLAKPAEAQAVAAALAELLKPGPPG